MTQLQAGDPGNYTIGGLRMFFNEIRNGVSQGYLYLGNVSTGGINFDTTKLDHFTSRTGTRLKDRTVIKQFDSKVDFTLDEPCADNMRLFMLGGDLSSVAVGAATAVAAEPIVISSLVGKYLAHGGNVGTIVVTKLPSTALVANTDYTVTMFLGYAKITRIAASSACADGDPCTVSYVYDKLASVDFKPAANVDRRGSAILVGASDVGNEFSWEIASCQFTPNGAFNFDAEDWSKFSFSLDLLDNSGVVAGTPFGVFHAYGTNQNI